MRICLSVLIGACFLLGCSNLSVAPPSDKPATGSSAKLSTNHFMQADYGQVLVEQQHLDEMLARRMPGHKFMIATAVTPAKPWSGRQYLQRFAVSYGDSAGDEITAIYAMRPEKSPIMKGTRMAILGNWHKVGFNVIAIGSADDKTEEDLKDCITKWRNQRDAEQEQRAVAAQSAARP